MGYEWQDRYVYYCPKCGDICFTDEELCTICGHVMIESPHEYGLLESEFLTLGTKPPECMRSWDEREQRLYDEVISESDIFDIRLYNRRGAIIEEQQQKFHDMMQGNSYQVECPYCKSNNVRRISGLSKAGAVAFFGIFGLGKASKE